MVRGVLSMFALVVLTLFTAGTTQHGCKDLQRSLTHLSYYPIRDMRRSVALMPQKVMTRSPDSSSVPTTGIELVPRDANGKPLAGTDLYNYLGATLNNPVASDDSSIARGQRKFMRTCVPCHGASLKGDGPVAAKFVPPPDLLGANTRGRKDGFIYAYIRNGGAIMPSYGAIVTVDEAWDLINYLRHMQQTSPR